jgi:hypothetical protein
MLSAAATANAISHAPTTWPLIGMSCHGQKEELAGECWWTIRLPTNSTTPAAPKTVPWTARAAASHRGSGRATGGRDAPRS